ncbi:MAG TPA: class I SAM-dependent methyltransferase [Candidatus Aminicenantes bacterium]|nr:class I SAM-dependent methyltransferase [Candidatus Aminicenantes bacterium]
MVHGFDVSRRDRLHSPRRHGILPPLDTLKKLGLKAGDHMADIGCGTGFFAIPAATIVGPTGRVIGIDPSLEMRQDLEMRAREAGVRVHVLEGRAKDLPLESESVTFALMVNVLHEVESPERALKEMFRILSPGGMAAIVEWRVGANSGGPPPQHRLPVPRIRSLLEKTGFGSLREVDAGNAHVGVTALRKP